MANRSGTVYFELVPMNIRHCQEICNWRYEPPYDIYHWNEWDRMEAEEEEFGHSSIRETQYAAVLDEEGRLAGYAQFFPLVGTTRLGLGMKPELCGLGMGADFVRAIVAEAKIRAPEDEIDLEVLVWNLRARKAYEQAGFRITDRYQRNSPKGTLDVYCMVYEGDRNNPKS